MLYILYLKVTYFLSKVLYILYLKFLTIQYFPSFIQKKRLWCWLTEIEDLETAQQRAYRNIWKRLPLAYLCLDYERVRAHKQLNGHLEGTDESSFSTVPTQTQC